MAQADGRIVIETSLDTSNLTQGAKRIDAACKSAARSAGLIGERAQIAAAKAVAAYNRQADAVEQQSRKVDALREKLAQMEKNPVKAVESAGLSFAIDEVARLEAELGKASEKKQAFLEGGGTAGSRQFAAMEQQIKRIRKDLAAAQENKRILEEDNGNASQNTAPVAEALTAEQKKLDRMNEQLQIAGMSLARVANAMQQATEATGKYGAALEKTAQSQKDVPGKDTDKKMNDFGGALKKGIKSLLKYGLSIRSLYMLFRKLRTAIAEGIKNLAQFSSETNANMSAIKSSLTQVKNSLATAFQPILTAVAPALTKLCNLLSQAVTYIGMLFTALSGGTKFTKAIAIQEDYAKSLQGTSAAAKEAQQQLSGLDEINTWQDNSGGGGGSGVNPADMFETVDIDSKISGIADKIKAAFAPLAGFIRDNFVEPTKKWFAQLNFEPLISSAKEVWQSLQPVLSAIGNLLSTLWNEFLLPIIQWVLEELVPASNQLTATLFQLIGSVLRPLIDGIRALWEGLQPVIQWVKDVVLMVLEETSYLFSSLASVFEEKGDKIVQIFDGIGKSISMMWQIVGPVFALLKDVVGAVFHFISDIVSTVIGYIIDVFAGLTEFLAGVFTGDWERAWNGIKSIFVGWWDAIKGLLRSVRDFVANIFKATIKSVVDSVEGLVTTVAGFAGKGKDLVLNTFQQIKAKIISILVSIANAMKKPINAIIGAINGMISGVCSGINAMIRALNKLSFDVPDWVPLIGGKKFGLNIREVTAPQIPLLATGAVIPPNAPFAAVLGDQRHGNNIETPEALLRQVVREESGGSAVYQFVAQLNRRTIFQEMIDEAKLRQASSGVNPFLLGRV